MKRLLPLIIAGLVAVACAPDEGAGADGTDLTNYTSTPRATGPTADSTQPEPDSTQPADDEIIAAPTAPVAGEAVDQSDPIAEILGYEPGDDGYAEFLASTGRETEQLVAECMREQGFEYEPFSFLGETTAPPSDHALELSPDEYQARYGYGLATQLEDALTRKVDSSESPPPPPESNLEYYESLTEAGRQAYDLALEGEAGNGGCIEEATRLADRTAILFNRFGGELAAMSQQIEADPRVIEADDRWRQCMADAGYDFEHEGDAFHYVLSKLAPVNSAIVGEELAVGELLIRDDSVLTPELRDRLRAVVELELAVARADLECDKSAENSLTRRVVQIELEEEFVDANRQTLDELLPSSDS